MPRIEPIALASRRAGRALPRAAALLLFAGWLGYVLISGLPQTSLHVFVPTITLHALVGALAILYLTYLAAVRRLPGGTLLDWPVFLLLVAYGAATAASVNWRISLDATLQVVMFAVVFYAASDARFLRFDDLRRALMLVTAAAAAYALFVVGRDYVDWLRLARAVDTGFGVTDLVPPTVPRVHDVGDHPNVLATALNLAAPFFLVAAYASRGWAARLAALGGLVLLGGALFFTLSRGAWVGGGVAALLTVGGIVLVKRGALRRERGQETADSQRSSRTKAYAMAGVVALAVIVVFVLVAALRWESRPQWLFRGSLSPRLDAMAAGGEMFRDHPLLGAGPNTYALLYNEYSGEYPIQAIHAHNGFLQAAVDLGLPGIATMVAAAVVLALVLAQAYREGDEARRLLVVACGASILGFLVHALVDTPNIWKTAPVALAVVLAIVAKLSLEGRRAPAEAQASRDAPPGRGGWTARLRRAAPLIPRLSVAGAILALLLLWATFDGAHHQYSRSLDSANRGDWLEAVPLARRAAERDPDFALYQLQLGLSEVMAYRDSGVRYLLDEAVSHLRRGTELEPRSAIGHANLARAYLLAGREEEAFDAALGARRWAGRDTAVLLAAGNVLEELGREEEAIETYALVLGLDSELIRSPFWSGSDFRSEHYDDILGRTGLALNPCLMGQLLGAADGAPPVTGDLTEALEGCAAVVYASPENVPAKLALAELLTAAGETDVAFEHLSQAVDREPDNAAARTALGEWYAETGDVEEARHQWLLGAQLEDPQAALLLGDSYLPGRVPDEVIRRGEELLPLAGGSVLIDGVQRYLLGILYYRMRFGRQSPVTILIPGDWQEAAPAQFVALSEALARWRAAAPSPG